MMTTQKQYKSQSARDAQEAGYGSESYWDQLDQSAQEHYEYFMGHGDPVKAQRMFTQSLGEALTGNESD